VEVDQNYVEFTHTKITEQNLYHGKITEIPWNGSRHLGPFTSRL